MVTSFLNFCFIFFTLFLLTNFIVFNCVSFPFIFSLPKPKVYKQSGFQLSSNFTCCTSCVFAALFWIYYHHVHNKAHSGPANFTETLQITQTVNNLKKLKKKKVGQYRGPILSLTFWPHASDTNFPMSVDNLRLMPFSSWLHYSTQLSTPFLYKQSLASVAVVSWSLGRCYLTENRSAHFRWGTLQTSQKTGRAWQHCVEVCS